MFVTIRMIVGIIILFVYFITIPTVIGITWGKLFFINRKKSFLEVYLWGNIVLWGIFQIVCVPMGILKFSFTVLTILFLCIILLLVIYSFFKYKNEIITEIINFFLIIRKIKRIEWLVIIIILVQVGISVFAATYIGMDDAAYIAASLDAVEKDTIAGIDYYTGKPIGVPLKILLTSWNYYISFLGKLSGVHVAILAHSILPIILIPMSYIVFYLLSRLLFDNNRKKSAYFMVLVNILILFGAYSWYTVTLRLDICIWHGKAVMATILLPFLLYFLIDIDNYDKKNIISILFIMLATCAMSLMGVGLSIMLVLVSVLVKYHKKNSYHILSIVGIIALIAIIYFVQESLFDYFSYDQIKKNFPNAVSMMLETNLIYWNKSNIQWCYYLCLLYLFIKRKENRINSFLVKYIIGQYIIIYNPIFFYIAYLFLEGSNVYVRLYYILFPEICMAYVLTSLIFYIKKVKIRTIYMIVFIIFIMYFGTFYFEIANFSKPQNIYKLPEETIQICNIINDDSLDEEPIVVAPDEINIYLRQYSSRIGMLFGRGTFEEKFQVILYLIRNQQFTVEELVELMRENGCKYLVSNDEKQKIYKVEKAGGKVIGRTKNYIVLKID